LVPGIVGLVGILLGIWIGAWGVIVISGVWRHQGFDRHGDERPRFQKDRRVPRGQFPGQLPPRKMPPGMQPPVAPSTPAPAPSPS
jgi:hypothetical protein